MSDAAALLRNPKIWAAWRDAAQRGAMTPDQTVQLIALAEKLVAGVDGLHAFAAQVARMTTLAEHTPADPDDATLTLDGLILRARELTGGGNG
jgi:hypothetical protein